MNPEGAQRGTPLLWIFGLVTFGAAALVGVQKPLDQQTPTKATEGSAKVEQPVIRVGGDSSHVLDVLRDHLRLAPVTDEPPENLKIQLNIDTDSGARSFSAEGAPASPKARPELSRVLQIEHAEYEFLIASVPDPIETKFPHEFDAVLDGIQRAFEARKFVLRASWMPWPRNRDNQAAKDKGKHPRHLERPGVLLFRKSRNPEMGGAPDPLAFAIVCLVGESPVSGIHKPAMASALSAYTELDRAIAVAGHQVPDGVRWSDQSQGVKVISPYFSGSQSSLILAIKSWQARETFIREVLPKISFTSPLLNLLGEIDRPPAKPTVSIINGSATALVPRLFREAGLDAPQSTVIPNDLLTRAVLSYLGGNRGDAPLPEGHPITDRVAFLRESNTGFGAIVQRTEQQQLQIDFPIPLSISQLQLDQERAAKQVIPQSGFVEPKLPVRDSTQLDAIPPYDPKSAATTAGESLRMIFSTIDRARVRYVGITVTDTRDVVFLNRLLRKECPGVRVFTTEPSIALLHPDDAQHLRGMVVGSTYPLAPITQRWATPQGGPRSVLSFATQGSQGYYNAVLAQFGAPEKMLGYNAPQIPGPQTPPGRPPIWISVVGQGGRLVPVHCYGDYELYRNVPGPDPAVTRAAQGLPALLGSLLRDPRLSSTALGAPLLWMSGIRECLLRDHDALVRTEVVPPPAPSFSIPTGVLLGSVLSLLLLLLVIATLLFKGLWRSCARGAYPQEADHSVPGVRGWVWAWRGVLLSGVLFIVLPYALPARETFGPCCGIPGGDAGDASGVGWRHWAVWGLAWCISGELVLLAAILICFGFGGFTFRGVRIGPSGALWPESRWGHWALAGLVLITSNLVAAWWLSVPPIERFFLYVRASDLTSGLSPMVPMGFIGTAVAVLAWFYLQQIDRSRKIRLGCPYPGCWSGIHGSDEQLRERLQNPGRFLTDRKGAVLLLVLGFPFLLCALWNSFIVPLPSGERRAWDRTMLAVFWLTAATVLLTLVRFLSLWRQVQHLLGEIVRVPMVSAFERLPPAIRTLFSGYLFSDSLRHRELAILAWALPPSEREELFAEIREDRPHMTWVFGPTRSARCDTTLNTEARVKRDYEDITWLSNKLRTVAEKKLTRLPTQWRNQSTSEAFGNASATTGQEGNGTIDTPGVTSDMNYVAAYVVLYVGIYFAQLRMMVYAMAASAPLLLLAVASYPFQPERPQLLVLLGLLGAIAAGTVYVLYCINKNGLISRITGTTPNRFTFDPGFFSSVSSYVLPLVAVAILQVFGLFRFILEPLLGFLE